MKIGRLKGLVEDGAILTITAVVGVIVIGRALEMLVPAAAKVPVLGQLLRDIKAAWWTVYNP